MEKLKRVSPHSLEGDDGWQMRDHYNECIKILEDFETKLTQEWQNNITAELTLRLKQPLLVNLSNIELPFYEHFFKSWQ